jgi:amino-acid N-acetyltransferase
MKKLGIGRIVVEALEQEARENELHAIFAFTYVPGFFSHMGFMEVDRGSLPLKAWKDCLRCPKFQCCDEIAVLKALCDDPVLDIPARLTNLLVELPQVRR